MKYMVNTQFDLKTECVEKNIPFEPLEQAIKDLVALGVDAEEAETIVRKKYMLPYYENPY